MFPPCPWLSHGATLPPYIIFPPNITGQCRVVVLVASVLTSSCSIRLMGVVRFLIIFPCSICQLFSVTLPSPPRQSGTTVHKANESRATKGSKKVVGFLNIEFAFSFSITGGGPTCLPILNGTVFHQIASRCSSFSYPSSCMQVLRGKKTNPTFFLTCSTCSMRNETGYRPIGDVIDVVAVTFKSSILFSDYLQSS